MQVLHPKAAASAVFGSIAVLGRGDTDEGCECQGALSGVRTCRKRTEATSGSRKSTARG